MTILRTAFGGMTPPILGIVDRVKRNTMIIPVFSYGYMYVCLYEVYYIFCIMMMLCQDDKIECGLAEVIKEAYI